MISEDDHDEIIALFYSAATGDIAWQPALERTATLFGSSSSLLGVHHGFADVRAMDSHSYSGDFIRQFFAGEVYANDPRIPYLDRVPLGGVYYDEMLYDVREMECDPWVKESIDQLGVFDQIGAKLRIPGDCFVSFGLLRTRAEGRIGAEAVAAFERLVPPLERACALGYLIERAVGTRQLLLNVLDRRDEAIILLDRSGAILFLNDAARALLAAQDGLALHGGAFVTARPPETRRLQHFVAGVLDASGDRGQSAGGRMLISRRSGGRPYVVNVTAPPRQEAFLAGTSVACVVHVQDLSTPLRPRCASLRDLFGLTRREAELAVELTGTTRLDQAAASCGMALNTARNHLRSIFGKSGTNSQAEVMQLFGRIAAGP